MFKKLKDKIAEDLKFSPQRIQQLTQTVTDKLQNSTGPEENFFSIAEDDNTSPTVDGGFTDVSLHSPSPMESRTRRLSGSSMASDISFLPRYDPPSNMYHMQSDLDVSASEFEDNVSTSSQLGQISKEQVHAAFQKAQMRYHKYRGRYTDLANHYKILEKENAKIKSVLVETQDKAIRRANELREQCTLEQKAKAHLENALRVELDEKQMKIDSLETKIKFLQSDCAAESNENGESVEQLRAEIEGLNQRIQETKANVIIFGTKEAEYRQKIGELERGLREKVAENAEIAQREKENNLKIAETKMELHAEINNKDVEINKLKVEIEKVRQENEGGRKAENLQSQNVKLIEKVEGLTQKCSRYENDLIKLEQRNIEVNNLNEVVNELKKTNKEFEGNQKDYEETKKDNESLKLEVEKLNLELEGCNESNRRLEFEIQELNEEKENVQKDLIEKINCEYKKRQEKVLGENSELKETIDKLKQTNETTVENLHKEHQKAVEIINSLQEKNQDFNLKLKDYNEMKNYNEKLVDDIKRMGKLIEELTQKNEGLKSENEKLSTVLNDKENDVEKVRNEARNSLITLENKIKEKLQTEFDQKGIKLKEDFDHRVEMLNTSKNTEKELVEALDKLKLLEEQNEGLKTSMNDFNLKYSQLETNHLDLIKENSETLKKISDGDKEVSKHLQQIKMMEVQLKSVRDDLSITTNHKGVIENEYRKLEGEIDGYKAEIERFNSLRDEYNLLQDVSSEQQNKNCLLIEENKELKLRNEQDHVKLMGKIKEFEIVLEEKTGIEGENERLKLLVTDLEKFEEKYQNILDENHNLKEQVLRTEDFNARIAELRGEIEKLHKQKQEISNDSRKSKQEILDLKISIETYRNVENANLKLIEDIEEMRLQLRELLNENQGVKNEINKLRGLERNCMENSFEFEALKQGYDRVNLENAELMQRNQRLTMDYEQVLHENEKHLLEFGEFKLKYDEINLKLGDFERVKQDYLGEITELNQQIAGVNEELNRVNTEKLVLERGSTSDEIVVLKNRIKDLEDDKLTHDVTSKELKTAKTELNNLTQLHENLAKEKKLVENQLRELEKHYGEITHEKQLLLDEIQELKITPLNLNNAERSSSTPADLEILKRKLEEYKSLDKANRTSIEFYEHELQKLRNKNEKLGRKLDETLVTLPAITNSQDFSDSAAILEYLRNVIFNYMTGKESLVLAKVIAAVCKFDKDQTELVLQREQQKQSLLGQFFAS